MSRQAIEVLVHRYADAVVRRDAEQWATTWATEGVWTLTPGREVAGRDAIVGLWTKVMARFDGLIQHVHNGDAVVDEERGTGRWHFSEYQRGTDGNVGMLLAHYDDTYVREDGEWRFASRTLVPHYLGPPDLTGTFFAS